jgi:uncharacterized repeat protein (TIGR03803 family)
LAGCGTQSLLSASGARDAASRFNASGEAGKNAYVVLYAFAGTPDGANPYGGVILAQNGVLFGTTRAGGTSVPPAGGAGTIFALTPAGKGYAESIVYDFGPAGINPNATPTEDTSGDLFASAMSGDKKGSAGSIVKLSVSPSGGYAESAGFDFKTVQGATPNSPLLNVVSGSSGPKQLGYTSTLYTVANTGGKLGFGSIAAFTLSLAYTSIYNFQGPGKGDGADPTGALAVDPEDPSLFVYGATAAGGAHGLGTVFDFSPKTSAESVLYSFKGGKDGATPAGGVIVDDSGNIYGTTQAGGSNNAGVVFKLTKTKTGFSESVLHAFGGSGDGATPLAPPAFAARGNEIYGTTSAGGANGAGTIYQLTTTGSGYSVLHAFEASTGATPGYGGLLIGEKVLYGTTESGGAGGNGVVYRLTL